jgi:hypothetical protein
VIGGSASSRHSCPIAGGVKLTACSCHGFRGMLISRGSSVWALPVHAPYLYIALALPSFNRSPTGMISAAGVIQQRDRCPGGTIPRGYANEHSSFPLEGPQGRMPTE